MKVSTVGRSHYWGDIHKNLATNWVEKADLTEAVVSETRIPGPFDKMDTYVERRITIRNVTRGNWHREFIGAQGARADGDPID